MFRLILVALAAGILTPWYGLQVLALAAVASERKRVVCRRAQVRWCRGLMWAAGVKVDVRGLEHLAGARGQILVANHASWFDVTALAGYLPVEVCFIGKKELARIPIFGPAFQACGHIPIDREDREAAIRSLDEAGARIRIENKTVILFPEGTRTATGALQPFKHGAFVLAIQAGVPVVPVAIHGSRAVLPKDSLRVRPGTIRIEIGEPIDTSGYDYEGRERLTQEAWLRVAGLLEAAE